jgi:prepilin-type N-terminal cleavage/methylation domain-containing protein
MKKAFTLIELLVVIAIIAILAAILFPVFAQAKLAAKKAVSISNQKQIGLAMIMYANDADDKYPRADNCTLNDSLNPIYNTQPAGTDPTPWCTGANSPNGGFAFRDNHYSWQKWPMPYIKNTGLWMHPAIQADPKDWTNGELEGGYALNGSVTGELNTWGKSQPYSGNAIIRDSFVGGTTTSVATPANTMLVMEQILDAIVPALEWPTSGVEVSLYPMPREHWQAYFFTQGGTGPCGETTTIDPTTAPFNLSIPLSFCDGHTKTMQAGQFLAQTPASVDEGIAFDKATCQIAKPGSPNAVFYYTSNQPAWTTQWPLWGMN